MCTHLPFEGNRLLDHGLGHDEMEASHDDARYQAGDNRPEQDCAKGQLVRAQ
jgi:hypothetical protein